MKLLKAKIVRSFNALYYEERKSTWDNTYWMGIRTLKCPTDLWIYQEILFGEGVDFIVETGTHSGGSALFLAHMCDLLGRGEVVTIDVDERAGRPQHPRIKYVQGSSTDPAIVARVTERARDKTTLVILDSDHRRNHVLDELRAYGPLTPVGNHLIVEDTNINGHPVKKNYGPGPMEAVEDFLREDGGFEVDESMQKFMVTFNPRGYLKRVRAASPTTQDGHQRDR